MRLGDIDPSIPAEFGDRQVSGFAIDHRKIAPGTVFGAFRGARFNGEDYIGEAIEKGAAAIVARPDVSADGAAVIADANPRRRFAHMAGHYYRPVPGTIAAVTGTNGKTSVAELTRQLWRMNGRKAASIGTLGVTTESGQVATGLTTPDIVTFLSNMCGLAREGVTHAIYEASSHGLDQYRSEGLPVAIAAFTNLSRDHLDYHGDMESYFAAKLRLFEEVIADGGAAVIWSDGSEVARRVYEAAAARGLTVYSVGPNGSTLRLLNQTPTKLGQTIEIEHDGRRHQVELPLIGGYQAANMMVAAGIALASGEEAASVLSNLTRLEPVRGRLERAAITRDGAPVYIDYAHTPDAIRAACEALRPHVKGRLITVFGAGGDRDTGKRPEMAATAHAMSDVVIVTDDNPRSEDPASIRAEIMAGFPDAVEIAGRREAIAHAISTAGADDVVLLAGKGHEQGQEIAGRVLPFDDAEIARECAA